MSNDVQLVKDALAQRLGLAQKPSGGLDGVWEGAPLQVTVQVLQPAHHHQHGAVLDLSTGTLQPMARDPLQLRILATLPFQPALDGRLTVAPVGAFEALRAAGRSGFDGRFALKAPDAERAAALLPPAAREALSASFVGDPGVGVTDAGITWSWQRQPPYPTVDEVVAALAPLPVAWKAIVEASRGIRPPTGLEEVLVTLGALSLPPGLELRGSPVGMMGELDGVPLSVTVAPFAAGGWLVRVRVGLPEPIPGAPKVVREDRFGWFDRLTAMMAGRGEIVVGDAAFDRRFAVRSLKPDALKEALSRPVREAMVALDKLLPVELSAAKVEASGPIRQPAALVTVAEAALALAGAVSARG
jgi:hypothetical protein